MEKYADRRAAGKILAEQLKDYANNSNIRILALPRGGVPVAYEVAKALLAPLDIFVVRKLGVPGYEELAMGAIASGETIIFNDEIINAYSISKEAIEHVIQVEKKELNHRELLYCGERPHLSLKDKTIILVDDGIATGATMQAALKGLVLQNPAHIIIATPVAALSIYKEMEKRVEKIICPLKPIQLNAVGAWYDDFSQTTNAEVAELLTTARQNYEKAVSKGEH